MTRLQAESDVVASHVISDCCLSYRSVFERLCHKNTETIKEPIRGESEAAVSGGNC